MVSCRPEPYPMPCTPVLGHYKHYSITTLIVNDIM